MQLKILSIISLLVVGIIMFIILNPEPQNYATSANSYVVRAIETNITNSMVKEKTSLDKSINQTRTDEVVKTSSRHKKQNGENIVKPVFDGTMYFEKPDRHKDFFPIIPIIYNDKLHLYQDELIDVENLKRLAKSLPKSLKPYILDIECWNIHSDNDIEDNRNIDKYILVIKTMKETRPDLKFGYYGVLPNRDYWAPIKQDIDELRRWYRINNRLKRLAQHVDVVCPSLYTFYNDPAGWKRYASENIKRAKEYGKPVYPFLWPQYHEGGNVRPKWKDVDSIFWRMQLDHVYSEADGIIIWGAWDLSTVENKSKYWDDNLAWWKTTKIFIYDKMGSNNKI